MTESNESNNWGVRITIHVANKKAAETVHNAVWNSITDLGYVISESAYGNLEEEEIGYTRGYKDGVEAAIMRFNKWIDEETIEEIRERLLND